MIRLRSLTCCIAICTAIQAEPAWRKELTPIVGGEKSQVGPITPSVMGFNVSWKGWLDAGKLRVEFAPKDADKPGMLVVRSNAASHGPASGLFPYRSHFWSEIYPDTLRPRFFHAVEIDRRERLAGIRAWVTA
ncbi:MAG: hypothetical protein ACO3RV_08760, partial [Luteolibacter sp.]